MASPSTRLGISLPPRRCTLFAMKQLNNWIYFKDLTLSLTIRELKSKYKSTTLGFLWIIVNPLLQMIVLTIVFSFFLKIQVENYPLFVFSGLLPWTFFSLSLQSGTSSLIANRDLIRKVSFPKELLPVSSVLSNLFNFLLAIILLIVFVIVTSGLSFNLLFLIPIIFLQSVLSIGIVLFLSSLDIYYRDISYILQSVLLVWFYMTPIFYPINFIPDRFALLYNVNPMVGIISSYQSILLKNTSFPLDALIITMFETVVILLLGVIFFKKRSKYFADWV